MSWLNRRVATLLFVLALCTEQSRSVVCYSYRGKAWPNQTQCEGSDACCGNNDECLPNRLCKSSGASDNVLVRGPCAVNPYNKATCAQICAFDEITQNTGLEEDIFPRVEMCDEGVYCCRFGDDTCCTKNIGLLYLDQNGILLSSAPSQTATMTSITSTGAASSAFTSTSVTPPGTTGSAVTSTSVQQSILPSVNSTSNSNSDSGSQSNGDESLAHKVGLGVGIPAAAIIAAFATWCIFFRRTQNGNAAAPLPGQHKSPPSHYTDSVRPNHSTPNVYEAQGIHDMMQRPVVGTWNDAPHEIMDSEAGARYH